MEEPIKIQDIQQSAIMAEGSWFVIFSGPVCPRADIGDISGKQEWIRLPKHTYPDRLSAYVEALRVIEKTEHLTRVRE